MKIVDGVITTTNDEPRVKRRHKRSEQENLMDQTTFKTTGCVSYLVGDGEFPVYMGADRPIYCSCPNILPEQRRMVNNLDYYCETCNERHLNARKTSILGVLNTKSCGWKIIKVGADGNCFFSCIQEAIRNTIEYNSDLYVGGDHIPTVYEMRDWWAQTITTETVTHMLLQIRSYDDGIVPTGGMSAITDLYRRWLLDQDEQESTESSPKRQRVDTDQPVISGKRKTREKPTDNQRHTIRSDSPLPEGNDLQKMLEGIQSIIRRDQGPMILWVDDYGIRTIAERLRLQILIVWTRKSGTSPFYIGGKCDDYVGTVILTNNESHFNLVSWIPPGQTDKEKRTVTIFPDGYYPDLLRRMFCCLHDNPHEHPLD